MTTRPLRLAIAGLGRWGKVLVDSVNGPSETARFTVAVGRDPARIAADAAARGMRAVGSLAEALADPTIDGIVLATPHSRHAEQIAACVAAGKPVLVEKPFTLTRDTAAAALAAGQQAGVLIAAAHNRRFLAPIVALKQMIVAGELGTVLHIETNFSGNAVGRYAADSWRVDPSESPAGGLAGSGIHHIDSIIFLDSPITEVFALTSRRVSGLPMDDTTAVLFRLRSGATASLLTMTATTPTFRIQVFGTKAKAELNGSAAVRGTEVLVVTDTDGHSEETRYDAFDIERAEIEAFAAAIRGDADYPISADDVLNGVAAFEAVSKSAAAGAPIPI